MPCLCECEKRNGPSVVAAASPQEAILETGAHPSPRRVEWTEEAEKVFFGGEQCPFPGGMGGGGHTENLSK